jgi:hypothetical protein
MRNTLFTCFICKDIFGNHNDLNNHIKHDHQSVIKIKFQELNGRIGLDVAMNRDMELAQQLVEIKGNVKMQDKDAGIALCIAVNKNMELAKQSMKAKCHERLAELRALVVTKTRVARAINSK